VFDVNDEDAERPFMKLKAFIILMSFTAVACISLKMNSRENSLYSHPSGTCLTAWRWGLVNNHMRRFRRNADSFGLGSADAAKVLICSFPPADFRHIEGKFDENVLNLFL
jgi:hypothetical protein